MQVKKTPQTEGSEMEYKELKDVYLTGDKQNQHQKRDQGVVKSFAEGAKTGVSMGGMPKGKKMDGEELKRRRLEARRLFDEGVAQAEVARRLQTSRQSEPPGGAAFVGAGEGASPGP